MKKTLYLANSKSHVENFSGLFLNSSVFDHDQFGPFLLPVFVAAFLLIQQNLPCMHRIVIKSNTSCFFYHNCGNLVDLA